jgi:hypothetical protein
VIGVPVGTRVRILGGRHDGSVGLYKRPLPEGHHLVVIAVWKPDERKWYPYPALAPGVEVIGPARAPGEPGPPR